MWQNILAASIVMIAFVFIMAALYGLVSWRKVKARKQYFNQMHQDLKVGRNVIIASSIYGTLTRIGDETVDIKVKSGAVIEVSRYAVTEIL